MQSYVAIGITKGTIYLKMFLIPKEIWNDTLEKKREDSILK